MKVKNYNAHRFYKSLYPNKIQRTLKNLSDEELINYWNRFNKKYQRLLNDPSEKDSIPIYMHEDKTLILEVIKSRNLDDKLNE